MSVNSLLREAREYVSNKVKSVFAVEPQLAVSAENYDFLVRFFGRNEIDRSLLINETIARLASANISLYAHIPQCVYRCKFCTFGVTLDSNAGADAHRLLVEADNFRGVVDITSKPVTSLYFGGGTPTVLPPESIRDLVGGYRRRFNVGTDTEVTMEGSPDTISPEKVVAAREAGVTRFSVGVQTFDEAILANCDRRHTATQADESVVLLCESGFREVNVDLMRGLPGQTLEGFAQDLLRVIEIGPHSIYIYRMRLQRAYELPSRFLKNAQRPEFPALEDVIAMQFVADRLLREHGYHRRHTAHWSKKSDSTRYSVDRWQRQEVLFAFGWMAYSFSPIGEYYNVQQLGRWRQLVDSGLPTYEKACRYTPDEEELRWVMFTLKTLDLSPAQFSLHFGKPLSESVVWSKLQQLVELRILEEENGSLTFSDQGFLIAEEAIRFLSLGHSC